MQISGEFQIAVAVYFIIAFRWILVINKYQKDVLADDDSYEFKSHPVFKGILLMRAVVLGTIAPVMAFVRPSYINQFFDGVQVTPVAKKEQALAISKQSFE